MQLYKVVGPKGEPLNGGSGLWPLPTEPGPDGPGTPGEWRTVDGPLAPCRNGLHLTDAANLAYWAGDGGRDCVVYRAETEGEVIDAGHKYVAGKVRLLPGPAARVGLGKAIARRDAAYRRAARARQLASGAVPAGWATYIAAMGGSVKLPTGHPVAQYLPAVVAAIAADRAERDRAEREFSAAYSRARAAFEAQLAALAASEAVQ